MIELPPAAGAGGSSTSEHGPSSVPASDAEEYLSLGAPIRGPSALTDDWRRFWYLTYTIARNEFKLKFFGSALGYVWQLMRPLLLFGVLYVVFTRVVKTGGTAKHFPAILLADVVMFTFFIEATAGSVRSVVDRESLVRKIQFPRMVIPLSVVLLALFNLSLNLIVVGIFVVAAQGVSPHLSWLELPLILLFLVVFATGVSMLLSALFVRFRDVQPIWDVVGQVLFYGSPVIYPIEKVAGLHGGPFGIPWIHLYMVNPLAFAFEQFRHAIIDSGAPSAFQAIGGWPESLIPLGLVAGLFVVGFVVFNRSAPEIAEHL
ncbi:MAG: ABC transporter permease [Actinobacteria bacterium]|nr:MAG: ABC transporter permease [Actinomycetota bacterium]